MTKKFLSLSLVEYDEDDAVVGRLMAIVSLAPIYALWFAAGAFANSRQLHLVTMVAGSLASVVVTHFIKVTIKQPRPPWPGGGALGVDNEYGMPSSHAQFTAFFCAYMASAIMCGRIAVAPHRRLAIITVLLAMPMAVATSRVYLGYHDILQVSAGVALGLALGWSWQTVTLSPSSPIARWLARTVSVLPPCRWLGVVAPPHLSMPNHVKDA